MNATSRTKKGKAGPKQRQDETSKKEKHASKAKRDTTAGKGGGNNAKLTTNTSREHLQLHNLHDIASDSERTEDNDMWSQPEAAVSTSTAPELEIASAELVSLLVEHPSLKDLYAPAITTYGVSEFRESLCLILKSYAKALKSGAKGGQEYAAGELVRSHARRVAHAVVAFHGKSYHFSEYYFPLRMS